jgi:hypothetical protein
MIISPCGWFCLEEPQKWNRAETRNSILLQHKNLAAKMEITSARKEAVVQDEDVFEMVEVYAKDFGQRPKDTTLQVVPENRLHCLHAIFSDSGQIICPAYVYWDHYCVRILLECPLDAYTEVIFHDLRLLLATVQPLIVDP